MSEGHTSDDQSGLVVPAPLGFTPEEWKQASWEPADSYARVPDEFQRLWTPHRMAYINDGLGADAAVADGQRRSDQPRQSDNPDDAHDDCPFCRAPKFNDCRTLIVARGALAFVVMNLYPYNSGHLLVCPYRHIGTYDQASPDEVMEIGTLTQSAMRVLRRQAHIQGFNLGMNQGRLAGAGVAGHLHQHIVPRWPYDANFFPIIAKTKAVPMLLGELRDRIASDWVASGEPGSVVTGDPSAGP